MFKISKRYQVMLVLIPFFIVGWFLFTYRILDVPPGINGDEAVIGLNATLVSRNGYDSNGRFLPLFTSYRGSSDWKQPITFYLEVLSFKIFGPSYFTLRAVSVFFALLGGAVIFFLIKELLDIKTAIWGLIIFATTPIVMIQSHLALENIASVPFIAFWLWMVVRYSKNLKNRYLIMAAVALALSVYSYLGLRLIMPPLVLLTIFFIYYLNKTSLRTTFYKGLIFILAVIPFLIVLPLAKKEYPGSFLGQYRPYQITSYQQLALPYLSSFDPSFLFIQGDITPYHSTGKQGVFLLATLPLFVAGIVKILQKRQPILIFTLTSFFLMPVLFGLGSDIHRGSRLLSLIPSFTVISSLGMMTLVNLRKKIWCSILVVVAVVAIFFNFRDFLNDYWYDYSARTKSDFAKPYHWAFEKAKTEAREKNLTPFIQNDMGIQNPPAIEFFENTYFPNGIELWGDDEVLPKNSVVIVPYYILARYKDVDQINFNDGEFGLLVNP